MFNIHSVSTEFGGKKLTLETGKLAKQAHGAVMVSYGDTRVLVTAVSGYEPKPGQSFFPLTVEFAERFYAAGRIPGSFFKREGRPTTEATLSARMIDRPIRPLFPEGYLCDTQVVATVLSYDADADIDVAAAAGVSAALSISDIPFNGPTAACRVGRINGQFIINPTREQMLDPANELEIMVAGSADAITMVEGGARQVSEDDCLKAILLGHSEIKRVAAVIGELKAKCGKAKRSFTPVEVPTDIKTGVEKHAKEGLKKALRTKEKAARYDLVDATKAQTLEAMVPASLKESDPKAAGARESLVSAQFELLQYNLMRDMILSDKIRIDGRDTKTIRPIITEAGLLPRAHGSALFTRGETQVLAAITLGTADDEQIVDNLHENSMRKYMLHYNFPPYSVGETGRMGGQSRREIGHGALAERAVRAILPEHEKFPYTVRVVCETLESNGSSSMGSVCSASMALMDAGVPTAKPVAGIAMGLIKEGDRVAVLSDILGDEDHLGDMDFKVAGTAEGVTAIQMDIKIAGVDESIMRTALAQAREGRLHILGKMAEAITQPRADMSAFAPRITSIKIPEAKIGAVIGPGGKMIKEICAVTGCKVNINDDGIVTIASNDGVKAQQAIDMIQGIVQVVEVGKVYKGTVKKIVDFGAFVGVLPNTDGLLHISEIAHERVRTVGEHLKEGDIIDVKVIDVDDNGKVKLSRKVLLPLPPGGLPPREGGGGGDRDRGPRGDFRGGDRGPRRDDRGPRRDDRGPRPEGTGRPPIPRGEGPTGDGGGDRGPN